MPASLITGMNTGVRISTIGIRSMVVPISRTISMITTSSSCGRSVSGSSRSLTIIGSSAMVISQEDTSAAATRNITIELVLPASRNTLNSSRGFSSR
ncbi:hypothetical protein D9M70_283400 [compost metagenome]